MTHQMWLCLAVFAISLNVGGFLWQAWSVFDKRSGEAISVAWFASSVGLEVVNGIYGWSQRDRLFTANAGVCIAGQILVLCALQVYKRFETREKVVIAAIVALIFGALVLPFKTAVQMAAQAVNFYGGVDQPIELKRGPGTGALAFWALMFSGLSSFIWTGYCWFHFGFWGPAFGYLSYSLYSIYMLGLWCKKAWSVKSS